MTWATEITLCLPCCQSEAHNQMKIRPQRVMLGSDPSEVHENQTGGGAADFQNSLGQIHLGSSRSEVMKKKETDER